METIKALAYGLGTAEIAANCGTHLWTPTLRRIA